MLILAIAAAMPVFAQETTGHLTGVVTDTTGAVLPDVTVTVTNKATAQTVAVKSDSAGNYYARELRSGTYSLRFEREGETGNVTPGLLNAYIAENLGEGFTAKDFRTRGGTLAAAVALAEHGPPASAADERRVLARVMRHVGDELGNTAAVARSSYVSPAVVEQWREGRTLEHFRPRKLRVVSGRDPLVREEEAALVSLLRSWRIRRARAA